MSYLCTGHRDVMLFFVSGLLGFQNILQSLLAAYLTNVFVGSQVFLSVVIRIVEIWYSYDSYRKKTRFSGVTLKKEKRPKFKF